ncbi:MAG TPA: maleylpyruvate isomerase family mycothiol-dependent enzyme [Jiangellales bacterium]|nr:maleylpyruvate isomerase family mycothiol-dependent enzyme [Jiangellales bacterium]
MDVDEVWRHTHEQRRALAALLADLSGEEWAVSSLCEGWTVRDVAAHVMRSVTVTPREMAVALLRSRGRFNALVAEDARQAAGRPVVELVAEFERHDGSRRHPFGTSVVDPLLDVLVHSQDIAVPLGRPHPMPIVPARVAARRARRLGFLFKDAPRRRQLEIRATDTDFATGTGSLVEGPIRAVLLLLTGRTPAAVAGGLTGPGVERLN